MNRTLFEAMSDAIAPEVSPGEATWVMLWSTRRRPPWRWLMDRLRRRDSRVLYSGPTTDDPTTGGRIVWTHAGLAALDADAIHVRFVEHAPVDEP